MMHAPFTLLHVISLVCQHLSPRGAWQVVAKANLRSGAQLDSPKVGKLQVTKR